MRADRMDRIVLYAGTIHFGYLVYHMRQIKYSTCIIKKHSFKYCFYVSVNFCIHCEKLHANALCQW